MRLASVVPFVVAVTACGEVHGPENTPTRTVGMSRRAYEDPTRPRWDGTGTRPLAATMWFATDPQAKEDPVTIGPSAHPLFLAGLAALGAPVTGNDRRPLVLLSHGTGGSALQLMWLAEDLVQQGFIVAAVDHHGNSSTEGTPSPQGFTLWWERARDISLTLDSLLADAEFGPHIDIDAIGVAGFSVGGYTALLTAGATTDLVAFDAFCHSAERDATCDGQSEMPDAPQKTEALRNTPIVAASYKRAEQSYRDPRVKAAVLLAPAIAHALRESSLKALKLPVSIFTGGADRIAPAKTNGRWLADMIPGARYAEIAGKGHYDFLAPCTDIGHEQLPPFCDTASGAPRAAFHRTISAEVGAFFKSTIGQKSQATFVYATK